MTGYLQSRDFREGELVAEARTEAAEAQVTSARVNLDFTKIRAPISGRIGHSTASVGDLVGPNTGNLTTLVSIDPIDTQFQISEVTYVAASGKDLNRDREKEIRDRIEVMLELTTGVAYPEVGRIYYLANRIDQATGTLEARARMPNPHSALVPGQYVRITLRDTKLAEGLFLPQSAVQADQQGNFVLTVTRDGTVARHNVTLGERREDKVLVQAGVERGDQVIVRGLQQVRPGMVVRSKPIAGIERQE